jgi:hypothetical protein
VAVAERRGDFKRLIGDDRGEAAHGGGS